MASRPDLAPGLAEIGCVVGRASRSASLSDSRSDLPSQSPAQRTHSSHTRGSETARAPSRGTRRRHRSQIPSPSGASRGPPPFPTPPQNRRVTRNARGRASITGSGRDVLGGITNPLAAQNMQATEGVAISVPQDASAGQPDTQTQAPSPVASTASHSRRRTKSTDASVTRHATAHTRTQAHSRASSHSSDSEERPSGAGIASPPAAVQPAASEPLKAKRLATYPTRSAPDIAAEADGEPDVDSGSAPTSGSAPALPHRAVRIVFAEVDRKT